MKKVFPLVLLSLCPFVAVAQNFTIQFERATYSVASDKEFNGKILISPAPSVGLFSGSFFVQITGPNTVGFSRVALAPGLDFDGPNESPAHTEQGVNWAAAQGTADFFSPTKEFHKGESLGTFTMGGLIDGDYTLELMPYSTIGTPDEVLFVDGNCQALDEKITFKSAVVTVGIIATTELIGDAIFNPQSGLFEQTVRLTNATGEARGNFRLLVDGIPDDMQLWNSQGNEGDVDYVDYLPEIAAGESIDLVLEIHSPTRTTPPAVTLEVVDSSGEQLNPDSTGAQNLNVRAEFKPNNGAHLLEFDTLENSSYLLQYSYDMVDWKTVQTPVQGTGSRVQWIDNGPPKTDCHPALCTNRFYRVIEQ